jgi:hypothetical protein
MDEENEIPANVTVPTQPPFTFGIGLQGELLIGWSDNVVVQWTTTQGIPYLFEIPSQTAVAIADRLKTEAAKPTRAGHA